MTKEEIVCSHSYIRMITACMCDRYGSFEQLTSHAMCMYYRNTTHETKREIEGTYGRMA